MFSFYFLPLCNGSQAALRTGMQILVHLVSHNDNRDLVLDSDLTEHLFGDAARRKCSPRNA